MFETGVPMVDVTLTILLGLVMVYAIVMMVRDLKKGD